MTATKKKPRPICPGCGSAAIETRNNKYYKCDRCGESGPRARFMAYTPSTGEQAHVSKGAAKLQEEK